MNLFQWLITSSADPHRISTTVKGFLLAIAPVVIYVTGLTEADFGMLVDGIIAAVMALTALISAAQIVFGIMRKISFGRWAATE